MINDFEITAKIDEFLCRASKTVSQWTIYEYHSSAKKYWKLGELSLAKKNHFRIVLAQSLITLSIIK